MFSFLKSARMAFRETCSFVLLPEMALPIHYDYGIQMLLKGGLAVRNVPLIFFDKQIKISGGNKMETTVFLCLG
jgi:hypothetical protein